jgi:hypothetical protein
MRTARKKYAANDKKSRKDPEKKKYDWREDGGRIMADSWQIVLMR